MDSRTILALAMVAAVAVTAAIVATRPQGGGEAGIVAVTFPGISDDVRLLLKGCEGVRVETIAPPGVDPHEYNLEPSKVKLVEEADLVISTGHAPFEARVQEIAADKTIVIPDIPGLRLLRTPTGAVNKHMPIYDPANYKAFATYTARLLEEKYPECRDTIEANLADILGRVDALIESYSGILSGRPAVLSGPVAQYAITWLGLDARIVLVVEHGGQTSPQTLEEAEGTLQEGGVAVIVYWGDKPSTQAGGWLEAEAEKLGAPIIRVPAPYTPGPILEKIEYVASQAEMLAG